MDLNSQADSTVQLQSFSDEKNGGTGTQQRGFSTASYDNHP